MMFGFGKRRQTPATSGRLAMKGGTAPDGPLRCSFCNKSQHDVCKLIAGPEVFICDDCVEVCKEIIADDTRFMTPEERKRHEEQQQVAADAARTAPGHDILVCRLCAMPTLFNEALIVEARGGLCAGCVAAVEAAAVIRRSDSGSE